jgi:LPS-assembly protein
VGSKDKERQNLLSSFRIKSSLPLKKEGNVYDRYLTPKISLMYSPNKTKDIKNEDRRTDTNNIFSFNRISSNTSVEGGQSVTIGSDYTIKNKKNNNDILNLGLGTVFRDQKNHDLPTKSTIGEKSSDIVGSLNLKPSKFIDFHYNFSLDNSLNRSNYDLINAKFKLNNFVTSFEFLEEKNVIGTESYLSNETSYNINRNNSLSFKTRKNRKTDLTEYYNLIYEYKNDCLIAGIEYNKEYYIDNDLKPEEQLFFSITIIPFSKTSGPNVMK